MSSKRRNKILSSRWFQLAVALCIAVCLYLFLEHIDLLFKGLGSLFNFISPVIIGIIIAYVMDPLVKVFERYVFKKVRRDVTRRTLSVTCTVVTVIVLLVLLLVVLIPQLISSISYFLNHMDSYVSQLQSLVNEVAGKSAANKLNIDKLTQAGNDVLDKITEKISGNVGDIVNTSVSVGTGMFNFVISFILAIYFLLDKKGLLRGCNRLMMAVMKDSVYEKTIDFLSRCNKILIRYIACDLLDGCVVGALNFIFMCIAGYPYKWLISIIVGVTNLAPTFGPIVGCVIGAFILLLVNPIYALVFILFTIALQTFDGYVFKPKLFGDTLGVSSIWILICIIVGGRMFGVWGILLAIPFAAIFDFVYHETIMTRLEKRKKRKAEAAEAENSDGSGGPGGTLPDDQETEPGGTDGIQPEDPVTGPGAGEPAGD